MSDPTRPNPDSLLLDATERKDGRLKIYIGMSAGVGKTYAMLSDGLVERNKGTDVVAGYIEPHERKDTQELARKFETLPPLLLNYRGVTLNELNTDAAIARKPTILLVDELAHTNAPGSRHAKRWQDVSDILRAGIDVHTTMNIQHVESLNDVVASITGVQVKETVPDAFFSRADSIELVDIPPEELIERLKEGKIYESSKINDALRNFFTKGNLIALRELVLRHTAERVDAQMRQHRMALGVRKIWPTTERILVCVAPNALSTRVVRAAGRMAHGLHAELIAISIESLRYASLPGEAREQAAAALRLAEDLGGEAVVRSGEEIAHEILSFARERNVTSIFIGKPVLSKLRERLYGSIVDDIIRESGEIAVHVISGGVSSKSSFQKLRQPRTKSARSIIVTLLATFLCTALGALIRPYFDLSNIIMIYLVGVTWVAVRFSRAEATLASIASVLAFDFFFVPPQLTFAVSDLQYIVTFLVMLFVGLCISHLTLRVRAQTQVISERERRTGALYSLSKKLSVATNIEEIAQETASVIQEFLGSEAVLMSRERDGGLKVCNSSPSGFESSTTEIGVAQWVNEHGLPAGKGTQTLPGARGHYLPLLSNETHLGVLVIRLDNRDLERSERDLLQAMAAQLALAIERVEIEKAAQLSQVEFEKEKVRSLLLSSVSHDLRTPLASITGAASSLLSGQPLPDSNRHELLSTINDQAARLSRIVRNVLDMTRLESSDVQLNREWHSIEELVGSAVMRTSDLIKPRNIKVAIEKDLPLIFIDGTLFEQALVNLLENVAKHTPTDTRVEITAQSDPGWLIVQVKDSGPGIASGDEERIFERLYRGKETRAEGTGFGLAICRAIMSAHAGSISASSSADGGAIFTLRLPRGENAPEVPRG